MIDGVAPGKPRGRAAGACRVATFSELYREHFPFVWRLARSLGIGSGEIDDVVQEVFLVVRRRHQDIDPDRSLRGWLAGITRRVVMRLQRGSSRRIRRELSAPDPAPWPRPDEVIERDEAAALVRTFLERLDPDKRLAFVLIHVEGFTAAEAATVADSNLRTMYSRAREAHRRFDRYVAALQRKVRGHG